MFSAQSIQAIIVSVMLLCAGIPLQGLAQTVIVGDCNVVINNQRVTGSTVVVGDISCPQAPEKTLRIAYHWLDSTSVSFLFANAQEGPLKELVGERPIVLQTDTYRAAKDLIDRFGVQVDASYFHKGVYKTCVGKGCNEAEQRTLESLPITLRRRIKVYDATDRIYLPDFEAAVKTYSSDEWPAGYKMYYTKGLLNLEQDILAHTVLWRHVTRNELLRYDQQVEEFRLKALKNPRYVYFPQDVQRYLPISPQEEQRLSGLSQDAAMREIKTLEIKKVANLGRNKALASMLYITENNWPSDFLIALGFLDGHADDFRDWNILVPPRQMYLQIAVIENIGGSGALHQIAGFSTKRSHRIDIRSVQEDNYEKNEFLTFTPRVLGKGERIVIPIKIEFRANFLVGPHDSDVSPSDTAARSIMQTLKPLSDSAIIPVQGESSIRKRRFSFRQPEKPAITPSYLYGPRYRLNNIVVDGRTIPLRQYNPNNVFMLAGYESGTCPSLYIQRNADADSIVKIGSILRAASGIDRRQTEAIDIGEDVTTIFLSEEELERTTIESITVFFIDKSDVWHTVFNSDIRAHIDYGESLEIPIPKKPSDGRYILKITGHYEPYINSMVRRFPDHALP